jgi:hypothetical protein
MLLGKWDTIINGQNGESLRIFSFNRFALIINIFNMKNVKNIREFFVALRNLFFSLLRMTSTLTDYFLSLR